MNLLHDLLQEALDEDFLVLGLDDALQLDVHQEVSTLLRHLLVLALDGDAPQGLDAEQVLEVDDVDHFEGVGLRVVVDVAVLGIHIQEEHLEAGEALDPESCAVKLVLVAHDLLEDIGASTLVEKELALATCR